MSHWTLAECVLTAGAAGPRLFTIHQIDANANNLPKAHTWYVFHAPARNTHTLAIQVALILTCQCFSWLFCSSSFNRVDIPPYESYDKLYDKLLTAIEETCGFAVE